MKPELHRVVVAFARTHLLLGRSKRLAPPLVPPSPRPDLVLLVAAAMWSNERFDMFVQGFLPPPLPQLVVSRSQTAKL